MNIQILDKVLPEAYENWTNMCLEFELSDHLNFSSASYGKASLDCFPYNEDLNTGPVQHSNGSKLYRKGHLKTEYVFENQPKYSYHPKTEPSDIRMVIPRTQFVSGFRSVRYSNVRDRTYLSGFFWLG